MVKDWTTNEMALAVFLSLQGHPAKPVWRDERCFWSFQDSPSLQRLAAQYAGGQALVEPQQYNQHFFKMKKEMFALRPVKQG